MLHQQTEVPVPFFSRCGGKVTHSTIGNFRGHLDTHRKMSPFCCGKPNNSLGVPLIFKKVMEETKISYKRWAAADILKKLLEDKPEHSQRENALPSNAWAYATALRGPDNGNDDVKEFTTAFIRGECGGVDLLDVEAYMRNVEDALWEEKLDEKTKQLRQMEYHFAGHVETALRTMAKEIKIIPEEIYGHFRDREFRKYLNTLRDWMLGKGVYSDVSRQRSTTETES